VTVVVSEPLDASPSAGTQTVTVFLTDAGTFAAAEEETSVGTRRGVRIVRRHDRTSARQHCEIRSALRDGRGHFQYDAGNFTIYGKGGRFAIDGGDSDRHERAPRPLRGSRAAAGSRCCRRGHGRFPTHSYARSTVELVVSAELTD
jgi:hypothetical protein